MNMNAPHLVHSTATLPIPAAGASLMESVDARTKLAGSNRMEILLFTLGTHETFGINVFKVREVSKTPSITKAPNMPGGVEGLISLRGNVIPVVSLSKVMGLADAPTGLGSAMMVTEYSKRTLGFLVHGVDRIIRVDWDKVRPTEGMLSDKGALITAITNLEDGSLVSILDVEQILSDAFGEAVVGNVEKVDAGQELCIFFADDSMVARRKITEVLDKMGVRHIQSSNGQEAWERLRAMAEAAQSSGQDLRDQIRVILTDAEMPVMDGYVLTQNIKNDRRFEGIPVVMHSSLSSDANRAMGKRVGVDHYVPKFDSMVLSSTLRPLLT